MIRKLNRVVQDFLRPKRLALGRFLWDRKENGKQCPEENIIVRMNIKKILFIRTDGKIGDMVASTMMFREIKRKFPEVKIGVVARGAARDIIVNSPYVDKIYSYEKSSSVLKKLTGEIRSEGYDLLLDFSEMLRVNDMKFINLCRAGINMGLDRKEWKLFDVSVESGKDFQWDEHITERYGAYLKKLGIEDYGTGYDVFLDSERERRAEEFCKTLKKKHPDREKIAIVNPYGASKYRSLNPENMENIFRMLDKKGYITIAIYSPDKKEELERFLNAHKGEAVYMAQNISSILDSSALIKKADLVITPDTSVVHIARAFDRKMIALYRKDRKDEHNLKTWGPEYPGGKVILSQADYREGEEIDINSFSMEELQKHI